MSLACPWHYIPLLVFVQEINHLHGTSYMYTEYIDEVDAAITECLDRKDINCRM